MRRGLLLPGLLLVAQLGGCDAHPTEPGEVSLSLSLSYAGSLEAGGPEEAFRAVDRARVSLANAAGRVLLDTIAPFRPAAEGARLRLALPVSAVGAATLGLGVELRRAEDVLFRAEGDAELSTERVNRVELDLAPVIAALAAPESLPPLTPGDTARIEAAALFATGDTIPDAPLSFVSEDRDVAEVDETGLVRARAPGETGIAITAEGGAERRVRVRVREPRRALRIGTPQSSTSIPSYRRPFHSTRLIPSQLRSTIQAPTAAPSG